MGTIPQMLPPPRSTLLSSFTLPHKHEVKGCGLTDGARALAKHVNRCSSNYWGIFEGNVHRISRAVHGGWPFKEMEALMPFTPSMHLDSSLAVTSQIQNVVSVVVFQNCCNASIA